MRIRGSLSKGLLIALAITLIPVSAISAEKISPGSACKVLNQKTIYSNKTYTCIKSGKKLVWNNGVAVKKPTPTLTPTPTVKLKTSDIQFFYSTSGCRNELGFLRMDEFGQIISKRVIVSTKQNVQLIPEDYDSGQLLFSTFNCRNSESALYKINVGEKSYVPSELLKYPSGIQIINAQ